MSTLGTNRTEFEAALLALLSAYGGDTGASGDILPERMSIINYAKIKLDEIIPEGEGVQFAVEDDVNISDPLNIMLNSILNEAAKRTLMSAPLHLIHPFKSEATATADSNDDKIGTIVLPDSFLRFVSLKMRDWKRPVIKVIGIEDERYMLQSNAYTRGGLAKPVAILRTSPTGYGTAVAQVDTMTITGTWVGGQAVIKGAGLSHVYNYITTITAANLTFVAANAADYLEAGVILTADGADLIFTASVAGTAFEHPVFYSTETWQDFEGTVVNTTANVNPYIYYKVIEYYSVNTSHVIDHLFYIKEIVAEDVQSNLIDALTWIIAGMVLQITERVDLAKLAFEQAELSYLKL